MNILELSRMMEHYASSGEYGQTDFMFNDRFTVRHNVVKSNNDRQLTISRCLKGEWDTVAAIIYEKEILDLEGKFKGTDRLLSLNQGDLLESYVYTSSIYTDLIRDEIVKNLTTDTIWNAYQQESPEVITALETGNIDFPKPVIVHNGNIDNHHYTSESFTEESDDINDACEYLTDYISDINNIDEIIFRAETEMAVRGQYYWHEILISKKYIFDDLHIIVARKHCALAKDLYLNAYIAKVSCPEGLGEFLKGAVDDILGTCNKVSDNVNHFKVTIKRTEDC